VQDLLAMAWRSRADRPLHTKSSVNREE
jgi:hypothetical protein